VNGWVAEVARLQGIPNSGEFGYASQHA